MLSHDDNETLVRVGPGTPMGQLMRLHWVPFLKSEDVAADGTPQRVRLLGEDLLAFRDSAGAVGLVDHACPHRGAPMVFGRNEDGGLRCVYHGWKFGVDGRCQDMPAEPEAERMRRANRPCLARPQKLPEASQSASSTSYMPGSLSAFPLLAAIQ